MNTRIAPFNSEDARRAVSYAFDRNEIIRLTGGRRLAQPTCQILPPNFPGYKRYCPYTLHPTSTGVWRAPDLAKAKRLIARSGTRGMHVTVLSDNGYYGQLAASYVVQLLDNLGYAASRKALPYRIISTSPTFSGARSTIQISFLQWIADYPSAAAFIQPALSCQGRNNDSGFCDPRRDREMRRALNLQPTDPRAAEAQWARIDRELVDAAPWVPYSNGKSIDFVSKRVGNFQFHPLWGLLLDQLWVR